MFLGFTLAASPSTAAPKVDGAWWLHVQPEEQRIYLLSGGIQGESNPLRLLTFDLEGRQLGSRRYPVQDLGCPEAIYLPRSRTIALARNFAGSYCSAGNGARLIDVQTGSMQTYRGVITAMAADPERDRVYLAGVSGGSPQAPTFRVIEASSGEVLLKGNLPGFTNRLILGESGAVHFAWIDCCVPRAFYHVGALSPPDYTLSARDVRSSTVGIVRLDGVDEARGRVYVTELYGVLENAASLVALEEDGASGYERRAVLGKPSRASVLRLFDPQSSTLHVEADFIRGGLWVYGAEDLQVLRKLPGSKATLLARNDRGQLLVGAGPYLQLRRPASLELRRSVHLGAHTSVRLLSVDETSEQAHAILSPRGQSTGQRLVRFDLDTFRPLP